MNKRLRQVLLVASTWWVSLLMAQAPESPAAVTLEQSIREALASNLDLAATRYGISVAEARRITAALRPNPVLTLAGQTLNAFRAPYDANSPLGPNAFNIHTDFPFERGHKREERIAVAEQDRSLAELGVREVARQVVFNVTSAYVDVQQAKANLQLAQENLARLQALVEINRARVASGDLAQVELDRSQLAALQYQTSVSQAQLQLDQAKTQLQTLLGRKQRTSPFDVADDFRGDAFMRTEEDVAASAMIRRPDLLVFRQSQARSTADLRLQLANGKVDYTAGIETTRQWAYGIGGSSLGLSFSIPLPFYNRNQGEIARAQREITQGGARIDAVEAGVRSEVERAFRQYGVSKTILDNVKTNMLSKARTVLDTTEYSYRRGEASLVEFLDAQRAFNETMQTYNEARANYARSLFWLDAVSAASL